MTLSGEEMRGLRLLLASAGGCVPIDGLADTGCWRTSSLLSAVDTWRGEGLLEMDASREQLTWCGERDAIVAEASDAEFSLLTAVPACLPWLLDGARRAGRERRFHTANILYRHLAQVDKDLRSSFPGGSAAWVGMVLEAIRVLRAGWNVAPTVLETAVSLAEEAGDLTSQAALLAARGVRCLPDDVESARRFFDRSLEAAEALESPSVRTEVRIYIATSLTLSGRPGEGITAFEALIGDVQADLLDPEAAVLLDLNSAEPASPVSMLALAYASVGDHPRAIDVMQRVVELGTRLENRALEAHGQAMLAVDYMYAGDRAGAARWAEAATPWFATLSSPYSWACAVALAWSKATATHPEEAHTILEKALPIWHATGRHWVGGSKMLELLQMFERSNLPPLDGLTVREEVARYLDSPQPFFAGIAHRWAAGRAADPHEAHDHLVRAVGLLREAGGGPELRLALEDSAEAATGAADPQAAPAVSAEIVEPEGPAPGSVGLLRLANAVLEMGRLGALAPPHSGLWGDVATRLCRDLGAERCAVVTRDETGQRKVRAARGSPTWCEAVLNRTNDHAFSSPVFEAALAPGFSDRTGQLVLIPFDDGTKHRGFVAIENRDTLPRVGPPDEALLLMLGRQMAILLANVDLWRELSDLRQRLEQENRYYREAAPTAPFGSERIVGESAAMRTVLDLVRRVAPSTTPVLVTGETGVGKELISREVHLASPRREGPFIAVHVASLSPGLVASALFGHERGAFTGATQQAKGRFELAHNGTLFLDEVGELSLEDQVRLLRVLQEGTFERVGGTRCLSSDFRLVAATNRDLLSAVKAGRFREDLYYRLAAFPIRVPPLRERRDEIPTLALFFMEQLSRKLGLSFDGLSERDMDRLRQYSWPGNVRELQHVIERAALLSDPPRLRIPPLERAEASTEGSGRSRTSHGDRNGNGDGNGNGNEEPAPQPQEWVSLEEIERRYIRRVLQHVHGRICGPGGAADVLRLKPTTLHFWIDRLGLREELAKARKGRTRKAMR